MRQLCETQLGYEPSQLDSAQPLIERSALGRSSSCPWSIIFLLLSQPRRGSQANCFCRAESCGVEGCWQVERSRSTPPLKLYHEQTDPVSNKLLHNPCGNHVKKPWREAEANKEYLFIKCFFFLFYLFNIPPHGKSVCRPHVGCFWLHKTDPTFLLFISSASRFTFLTQHFLLLLHAEGIQVTWGGFTVSGFTELHSTWD